MSPEDRIPSLPTIPTIPTTPANPAPKVVGVVGIVGIVGCCWVYSCIDSFDSSSSFVINASCDINT